MSIGREVHLRDDPIRILAATAEQVAANASQTEAPYAAGKTVIALFEDQAARTPDHIAVRFESHTLTYAQLNRRANQLAHTLTGLGVGPDVPVGICLPRSLDLAVAVLAVLKAGGAYLPLDPAYPRQRLEFMQADSQVSLVLSQQGLADLFTGIRSQTLYLDSLLGAVDRHAVHNLQAPIQSDNLAYVMYTSGSTGQPKGVAMRHGALSNLIQWHRQHPLLGQPAATLQFSALSFDVSFQEIFSTWCTGGELVLVGESMRRDLFAVSELVKRQRIERIFLPFVALQHLAELIADDTMGHYPLRQIITAGEQLQLTGAIRRMMARLDGCTLHNHYGPTEAHVVSEFILTGDPTGWPLVAPIGRPIANVHLYVLDAQMQPVPMGAPGDLYIGGAALAAGYLHRARLTAERFVPDPHSTTPGARSYRTGDLARWEADGHLLFLGRKDQQVKVRGFRIELGEVEAALAQHPAVSVCAVAVHEHRPVDGRLVAYWVARDSAPASAAVLREHLQRALPEYMAPAHFVQLDSLPLSPTGKVDRNRLPAPEWMGADAAGLGGDLPRTREEQALLEIWSDVLGVPGVGIHDNYFEIGGDSILAIQIAARASRLGLHVTVEQLMEHQTVAQVAAVARSGPAVAVAQGAMIAGLSRNSAVAHYRPTDFPNANLNQQELDSLLAEIRELGSSRT